MDITEQLEPTAELLAVPISRSAKAAVVGLLRIYGGRWPMTKGKLGSLDIEECNDITDDKRTAPNPKHRPPDKFEIWSKHVALALAMETLRQSGREYHDAVAEVAAAQHSSERTVMRAYARYSLEPADPNSAAQRRTWPKKVKSKIK